MHPAAPSVMRIYTPNIEHNPFTWMGIWTPHGWRVHRKRWGEAERIRVRLSGDGHTTFFPEALKDPKLGRVAWRDDLHLRDDPFTDGGIYPSDPRVEYPIGRPRWAVSHTLLEYPVADHTLYTHEYTWDPVHGHLRTHFRREVRLEPAKTDAIDGKTVRVRGTPISQTIEGNVHYPMPNSAVRGVWARADGGGPNLYTRRVTQLVAMHNGVYAVAPHTPVVQCFGCWATSEADPLAEVFDAETGLCRDRERLVAEMLVPLDEPKIAMLMPPVKHVASALYEGEIGALAGAEGVVTEETLAELRARHGAKFIEGHVGFAAAGEAGTDGARYAGYDAGFDLNGNGVIDEEDASRLAKHLGRRVRFNLYLDAYFGGDWFTTSFCLDPEHRPGQPLIVDYEHGAGYDADAGVIRLFSTPGPNQPVWVTYVHDAPAEAGENNIQIQMYRERP